VDTAKGEPAPAHVPAPEEGRREAESRAEGGAERLAVLLARDAAEQDELAVRPGLLGDHERVAKERLQIARLSRVDGHARVALQGLERDRRLGRNEAAARRDHEDARRAWGRCFERLCVRQLAPEVEAAQE